MEKLAIIVLGYRNSGKSSTWYELIYANVKTGYKKLEFNNKETVEVFVVGGSPEERGKPVSELMRGSTPQIVLCSVQYCKEGFDTLNFFIRNGYQIYCHWLNPGHHDKNSNQEFDYLGMISYLVANNAMVGIRNGQINATSRVKEIYNFIYGWSNFRNLIKKV